MPVNLRAAMGKRCSNAPSERAFDMGCVSACSRIHEVAIARALCPERSPRISDVFARASAGINHATGLKLSECALVQISALALPCGRRIRIQTTACQLVKNGLVCARDGAGAVYIFNPNQPRAPVGSRIQPTRKRCNQGACMQRARRRGGKASDVAAHAQR